MIHLIGNFLAFVWCTIINFIGFLFYGKLPKISMYHQYKYDDTIHDIFNDVNKQAKYSRYINSHTVQGIVNSALDDILNDGSVHDPQGFIIESKLGDELDHKILEYVNKHNSK